MSREDDPTRKMNIREYKDYCKGRRGKKSVNDSLLKNIDRATNGRKLTRAEFDQVHGKIKIAQELKKES
jgi:hypothetical protein